MSTQNASQLFKAPLTGTLHSIEASADPVFAQRMVGDGVMIEPQSDTLVAPFDGTVSQLHDAGHAVALKSSTGVEVLMHIGIDTVTLKGEGFESLVTLGQQVKVGQPLIRFDRNIIEQHSLSTQTVVLLTSGETLLPQAYPRAIHAGTDTLLSLAQNDSAKSIDTCEFDTADAVTVSADVTIKNHQGVHARPAAFLVRVAKGFQSTIVLTKKDNAQQASAHSVTAIMGLQLKLLNTITVTATGADADIAVQSIVQAINEGLGETVSQSDDHSDDAEFPEEAPLLAVSHDSQDQLSGVKAAPGMAVGWLQFRSKTIPSFPEQGVSVSEETQQLNFALTRARQSLTQLIASLTQAKLATQAEVFAAHLQLLDDPTIAEQCHAQIAAGKSAAAGWYLAYQEQAQQLKQLEDPLLRARGTDIDDVGYRVMQTLLGLDDATPVDAENTILVMDDITPSEVVALNRQHIKGLVTLQGGSTSHAAILASSLGIPYVVNVSEHIRTYAAGSKVLLNASAGQIQLNPSDETVADFVLHQKNAAAQLALAHQHAHEPAVTEDGCCIEVAANAASIEDAQQAATAGADAIGLVRSEFLYFNRVCEPSLQEQTDIYRGILAGIGRDKPCIIRTLDVGGDKPLPYLALPAEENPFLGERGIRIGLNRPHMLRKQIRAILQASDAGKPRIMFPMIASLEEFRAAKGIVDQERESLGVAEIDVGIMIEVPSAALMADVLANEVDFFSIGTNDLTQYTLAMDRGHPKLAAQVDALHPAVLRLIHQTAQASLAAGKWTGICGGIASDPMAVPILIGLGVTELSTSIPQLASIKAKVRSLDKRDCQRLAKEALKKSSAAEVRHMLKHHFGG